MRNIRRYEALIRAVPCRPLQGETGGLILAEQPGMAFTFRAAVRPDRKSERRVMGSLRPRERRLVFPRAALPLRQGDHLYFPGDSRMWHLMQLRGFPSHQEIEVEVAE